MTQANLDTCIDFCNGEEGESGHLFSYGDTLYSYNTMIAKRQNNIVLISRNNFSPTTQRHLSNLRVALGKDNYYKVPVDWNSTINFTYIKNKFISDINYYLEHRDCLKRKPNRIEFRKLWNDAIRYNNNVKEFIDTSMKIKVNRLLSEIKQD